MKDMKTANEAQKWLYDNGCGDWVLNFESNNAFIHASDAMESFATQQVTAATAELHARIKELEEQIKTLKAREEAPAVIVIGEPIDREAIIGRLKEVHADYAIMEREEFLKEMPSHSEEFIIKPLPIETLCYVAKENKPSHRRPYKFHR